MLDLSTVDLRVIPNGVDLNIFKPGSKPESRHALGLDMRERVLLVVGSAGSPWSDFRLLSEALSKISDVRGVVVVCVGSGALPFTPDGVKVVQIATHQRADEIAELMTAADVLVHPSVADTFPNVVIEALACGLPVVACDVGGIHEQIHAGPAQTGVLVKPRDVYGLSQALKWLLSDVGTQRRMSENAAEDARNRFRLDSQADAYLHWYEEVLERS